MHFSWLIVVVLNLEHSTLKAKNKPNSQRCQPSTAAHLSIEWKEERKAALYRSIPSGHQNLHSAKISTSYQFVKRSTRFVSVSLSVPVLLLGIQRDYTPRPVMSSVSLWIVPKYQLFWPVLLSLSCKSMSRGIWVISETLWNTRDHPVLGLHHLKPMSTQTSSVLVGWTSPIVKFIFIFKSDALMETLQTTAPMVVCSSCPTFSYSIMTWAHGENSASCSELLYN